MFMWRGAVPLATAFGGFFRGSWRAPLSAVIVALLGGVVAVSSPASAAATPEVAIAQGVVQSHGRPLAGARVLLYEWPDGAVLSRLRPGQAVPWKMVGSSTTGPSGAYALSVAPAALLPLAAPDGMANLELMVLSAAGQATFSFPRRVTARDGQGAIAPVDGRAATLANLQLQPIPRRAGISVPQSGPGCYNIFRKSLGNHWDVVGQTYSVTTDVGHTFVYQHGADSTLGVGFSASDQYGSWSEAGTGSSSSTAQVTYPTYGNGQGVYYETEFTYGLYQYGGACGGWDTAPTGYAGGGRTSVSDQAPGTVKGNCVPFGAGYGWTDTTTLAVEWTDGLNIAAMLGVDLSTQTGYSSTASVVFTFHAERDLCGTTGPPGGNPSQLVARN